MIIGGNEIKKRGKGDEDGVFFCRTSERASVSV